MRLWSFDLSYLDVKGLGALWREGLGAMKALDAYIIGKKCGYQNHPQLDRFKKCVLSDIAIRVYMVGVYNEAKNRGYKYNKSLLVYDGEDVFELYKSGLFKNILPVTDKQLDYEFKLLKHKLQEVNLKTGKPRNIEKYNEIKDIEKPNHNNFFTVIKGDIEDWEVVKSMI